MKKEHLVVAFLIVVILISGCAQSPVCGNGVCETGENYDNCPQDCQQQATHLECQNQQCMQVQGTGVDNCSTNIGCIQPIEKHLDCVGQQCIEVEGTETDSCNMDADCSSPPAETHLECQNQQCVEVQGAGEDSCINNADCQQCDLPENQIIKDKMIWDLPELCEFIYRGDWQPTAIDLRYISPVDNDQHSEYFLKIFNSPEEANNSFDDIVNTARNLWTVSMKEINGNKIYEGTSKIPWRGSVRNFADSPF